MDELGGPDVDTNWNIVGLNTGNLNSSTQFRDVEHLAGAADNEDTFVFAEGATISGVADGGDGGFDSLTVAEGVHDEISLSFIGRGEGTISLDGLVIAFAGLEPVDVLATGADFTLPGTAGDDIVRLAEGTTPGTLVAHDIGGNVRNDDFSVSHHVIDRRSSRRR